LLGVPGSMAASETCPVLAAAAKAAVTSLGDADGCDSRYTATAPVTCGAAMLQLGGERGVEDTTQQAGGQAGTVGLLQAHPCMRTQHAGDSRLLAHTHLVPLAHV
jgi:hypothetical protein